MLVFTYKVGHLRKIHPKNCLAQHFVLLRTNINKRNHSRYWQYLKDDINRDFAKATTGWKWVFLW